MSLKDIYCQDKAIEVFQRALGGGRLGHAYIFGGMEGVGKYKTAFEVAKVLLCEKKFEENGFYDSCGKCRSCQLFDSQGHPDFHHVYKELNEFTEKEKGKSQKKAPVMFPVDVIREFLLEKVSSKPSIGNYSVYVISETEKLNRSSQNAMLKVLEEPPSYCVLILLCTSMDKLLATTRSRCQLIRFNCIDDDIIVKRLCEEGVGSKEAKFWARFCGGSVGRAITWSGLGAYDFKREFVSKYCSSDIRDVGDISEFINKNTSRISSNWSELEPETSKSDLNKRVQRAVIELLASVYSDCMKRGIGVKDGFVNVDQTGDIEILGRRISPDLASEKVANCYDAIKWVDSNVNEKLVYDRLLLELAK